MPIKKSILPYVILALAFIIRLVYVFYVHPIGDAIYSDMRNYVNISSQLAYGEWRETHFFQPIGFPYLLHLLRLTTVDWIFSLSVIHVVTSTLSVFFIWKTAQKMFGEKIGLLSLTLASVHLPWIIFSAFALAENMFIFFLSLLLWLSCSLVKEQSVKIASLWSVVFFLAFLFKGSHVFIAPLFVLSYFTWKKKDSFKVLGTLVIIVSAGLLGHGLLTYSTIGKFQMSASAGGLNFVEGKCPDKNNADSLGYSWLSPLYHQMGPTSMKRWDHPFSDSSFFMKEGLKCIAKDPLVLIQSIESIPFLFMNNSLWPANQLKGKHFIRLYDMLFACFAITGLVIFLRFFKSGDYPFEEFLVWVVPVLAVFLCVYIFKSEIRFRIPFDVWIIPMSLKGWSDLIYSKRMDADGLKPIL